MKLKSICTSKWPRAGLMDPAADKLVVGQQVGNIEHVTEQFEEFRRCQRLLSSATGSAKRDALVSWTFLDSLTALNDRPTLSASSNVGNAPRHDWRTLRRESYRS